MKPQIIPAVLSPNLTQLKKEVKIIKDFSSLIQIDIADGAFVPNKTLELKEILDLNILTTLSLEFHLMVKKPFKLLENNLNKEILKKSRVYCHFETIKNETNLSKKITFFPFEIGLAINPETQIKEFKNFTKYFNHFLFLSVNPGFQGQQLITEVLDKIKQFKNQYKNKIVEIDGGVNEDNLIQILQTNVDLIAVGSYLIKNQNPKQAYEKLNGIILNFKKENKILK